MKNIEKLQALAEERGLEVVTVTSGRNGYPEHLRPAVTGFESIKDAEAFAEAVGNCEVVSLHQRCGWQFWEREDFMMSDPYDMTDLYEDDGYINYFLPDRYESEEDFIDCEGIKDDLSDIDSFDGMIELLQAKKKVWEAIENMGEDEMVLEYLESHEVETIKRYAMHYNHDSHNYAIAVEAMEY